MFTNQTKFGQLYSEQVEDSHSCLVSWVFKSDSPFSLSSSSDMDLVLENCRRS